MEETVTIKNVTAFDECRPFIDSFANDEIFSDPMLTNAEELKLDLIDAVEQRDSHAVVS